MDTQLTQMPCDFCPRDCSLYKPAIETVSYYADQLNSYRLFFHTILKCEHEDACKMWRNKEDK